MSFISNLINGLSLGSMYALIALGYTMVYGIAKMLNFAHGDVIMVGAFTMFTAAATLKFSPAISIIAGIIVCTLLGVIIEKIAYKPLRKASPLTVLITAIGVSYFLQSLALLIFGSNQKSFPMLFNFEPIRVNEDLILKSDSLMTMGVTILIMVALTLFINKTKTGRAMLAVSEDKGAAELMGVNVNKTISITFAIGSSLAAVAGLFFGLTYGFIGPYTGAMPGIKAFVAAVLGGIGNIPGAMLGGILLGVIENLSKAYISTELSDAIVFAVLIIVLLVKPTGLMGKKINEKV
ncbi:MAG: branched-chain amino acid ABC transporter permease [Clostridiales bacterium]|jgi:branched-chain amino acid transport system permease protein|nr:branched-chain amino acid ABC transporter permease [Clostridiales bacterium]